MKNTVSLRSTRRQPWHTVLLLLLCAGLSFAFLSQALQYQVVQNAVADSAGYYQAIGILRSSNTENEDASPCLPVLEKSEYVKYTNTYAPRYGVMENIYNADIDGDRNYHMLYLQGTLVDIKEDSERVLNMYSKGYDPREIVRLTFDVTNIFSGHPELASLGEMSFRMDVTGQRDFKKQLQEELQLGSSYFFCALWEKYYYPQFPAIKAQNTILHLGAIHGPDIDRAAYNTNDSSKYCYAVAEGDLWDYFYPVAPGSVVDFTDPALSDVATGLEYVQSNAVSYTHLTLPTILRV